MILQSQLVIYQMGGDGMVASPCGYGCDAFEQAAHATGRKLTFRQRRAPKYLFADNGIEFSECRMDM
ncbi:TPA: hypothetical protein QDC06_007992 [Burkholderia cepacia]|nr:hypothetical protein [Burkholderia cepacia]